MGRSTYERMAASDSIWLPRNSQTIHWSDKVHVDTFCMASEKQQYIKKPGISHDRTENACTVSISRCPIQSLRKVF